MKNVVYIVQDSPGKNLLPAKEYGDLFILLTGNEPVEVAVEKLKTKLSLFNPNDFLLLIGNPVFIGLATHFACEKVDALQVLLWDRDHYRYNKQTVKTN